MLALSNSCQTSGMHLWIFVCYPYIWIHRWLEQICIQKQIGHEKPCWQISNVSESHSLTRNRTREILATGPSGKPWDPVWEFWINQTKSWSALGTSRTCVNGGLETVCYGYKQVPYHKEPKKALGQVVFHWQRSKESFFIQVFECSEAAGWPYVESRVEAEWEKSMIVLNQSMDRSHVYLWAAVSKLQVSSFVQSLLMLQAQKWWPVFRSASPPSDLGSWRKRIYWDWLGCVERNTDISEGHLENDQARKGKGEGSPSEQVWSTRI